jgi:trehalose/maltose transport system substrate-binding protein
MSTIYIIPIKGDNEPITAQTIDLTIIVHEQQLPGVQNVTDDFLSSDLGSGINSITVISSGVTSNEQLVFLESLMESGTATSHVIGLDTTWLAQFASNRWIIDISPYLDVNELDDYSPGIAESCVYQGNTYAYPYFMNFGTLFYRKDLLDLHLPGWTEADFDTWEELKTTANYILNNQSGLLTSADADLVGYVGQFDVYEGGVVNFFEIIGSNGVLDAVTSTGGVNIDTQDVNDAMTFFKGLVPPKYTGVQGNDYIIPRYGLVHDEGSSVGKWLANESIFMRQWTFAYGLSDNYIDFGLAPLPHFSGASGYRTSCVGGSIFAIPTATTGIAREATLNLTKFMGDILAQEAELTSDADPGPGYHPLLNFPALKSVYDNPPTGFEWVNNWTDQAELTLTRPVHPKYPQISPIIADNFNDLLSCQKSADDALSDMQREVLEILDGPPGSFALSSNAGIPDDDGIFNLAWTHSEDANNYSVYEYSSLITEINENLTILISETSDQSLSLSEYTDGIYNFIVVAHNDYGNTSSNCIEVVIQIPEQPPEIPGYNLIILIGCSVIFVWIMIKHQKRNRLKL